MCTSISQDLAEGGGKGGGENAANVELLGADSERREEASGQRYKVLNILNLLPAKFEATHYEREEDFVEMRNEPTDEGKKSVGDPIQSQIDERMKEEEQIARQVEQWRYDHAKLQAREAERARQEELKQRQIAANQKAVWQQNLMRQKAESQKREAEFSRRKEILKRQTEANIYAENARREAELARHKEMLKRQTEANIYAENARRKELMRQDEVQRRENQLIGARQAEMSRKYVEEEIARVKHAEWKGRREMQWKEEKHEKEKMVAAQQEESRHREQVVRQVPRVPADVNGQTSTAHPQVDAAKIQLFAELLEDDGAGIRTRQLARPSLTLVCTLDETLQLLARK